MTHRPWPGPRARGFTLVSLLVGLMLSMLVTLGMLGMFKVTARDTAAARRDASHDDQLVSGVMRVQTSVQDAGFGIPAAAYGAQLVVLAHASLDGGALAGTPAVAGGRGNAVVWASARAGTVQCAGVLAEADASGGGVLRHLAPVDCGSAADHATLAWTASTWADVPATGAALAFTAEAGPCVPYGQAGLASALRLTVSGSLSTGSPFDDRQCLLNFRS